MVHSSDLHLGMNVCADSWGGWTRERHWHKWGIGPLPVVSF